MYFQIAFVTSTLLNFFAPQIAAKAGLRLRRTCARCAVLALNDMPFFVVFVVLTVVL